MKAVSSQFRKTLFLGALLIGFPAFYGLLCIVRRDGMLIYQGRPVGWFLAEVKGQAAVATGFAYLMLGAAASCWLPNPSGLPIGITRNILGWIAAIVAVFLGFWAGLIALRMGMAPRF
jgi:hypothetical protein